MPRTIFHGHPSLPCGVVSLFSNTAHGANHADVSLMEKSCAFHHVFLVRHSSSTPKRTAHVSTAHACPDDRYSEGRIKSLASVLSEHAYRICNLHVRAIGFFETTAKMNSVLDILPRTALRIVMKSWSYMPDPPGPTSCLEFRPRRSSQVLLLGYVCFPLIPCHSHRRTCFLIFGNFTSP